MRHALRIILLLCLAVLLPILPSSVRAESVLDRACSRMVKNFSSDAKMWDRVNDRVEKRFGSRCALNGTSIQGTSQTVSSSSSASSSPYCREPGQAKWACGEWSVCTYSSFSNTWNQTRNCWNDISSCRDISDGPAKQTCTPTTEQKQAIQTQQDNQTQQAELLRKQKEQQAEAVSLQGYKSSTITNYNTMTKNLSSMDSELPYYSGTTSSQLFDLSTQYSNRVSLMKIYYDRANNNTLKMADSSVTSLILQDANGILSRFDSIVATAQRMMQQNQQLQQQYQQLQQQIDQYQQQKNQQQTQQQCKQLENQLTGQLALSGGYGSMGGNFSIIQQLYNAGCTTLQQYCDSIARLNASIGGGLPNDTPAECR